MASPRFSVGGQLDDSVINACPALIKVSGGDLLAVARFLRISVDTLKANCAEAYLEYDIQPAQKAMGRKPKLTREVIRAIPAILEKHHRSPEEIAAFLRVKPAYLAERCADLAAYKFVEKPFGGWAAVALPRRRRVID